MFAVFCAVVAFELALSAVDLAVFAVFCAVVAFELAPSAVDLAVSAVDLAVFAVLCAVLIFPCASLARELKVTIPVKDNFFPSIDIPPVSIVNDDLIDSSVGVSSGAKLQSVALLPISTLNLRTFI